MIPISASDCEVDNTRCGLTTNHADAIEAYSGVKIRTEGRWTAPGFAPPEGVIPLHLRIEARFSSGLQIDDQSKQYNRGLTWRASLKERRW